MLVRWDQAMHTAFTALHIISIHSPTAAIVNCLLWGYILPQKWKQRTEESYA